MWYKRNLFTDTHVFFANRLEEHEVKDEMILMPIMFTIIDDKLMLIHLVLKREVIHEEDDSYKIKKISKKRANVSGKIFIADINDHENYKYDEIYKYININPNIFEKWYSLDDNYKGESIYSIDKYIKQGEDIELIIEKYILNNELYKKILNKDIYKNLDKKEIIKDIVEQALLDEKERMDDYDIFVSEQVVKYFYEIVEKYKIEGTKVKADLVKYYFFLSMLKPTFVDMYEEMTKNLSFKNFIHHKNM